MIRLITVLLFCILLAGCATGKQASRAPKSDQPTDAAQAVASESEPRPDVSFTVESETTLGELLPDFAESVGGSLVIMNGLQKAPVKPTSWRRAEYRQVVKDLAKPAQLLVEENSQYYFVYSKGYEALEAVTLEGWLDPSYDNVRASLGFGYGTPLFETFALLGGSVGITLVPDQMIGDVETGSLNLAMSPLQACLSALLKSARVPQDAFEVESNAEYIFIRAKSNAPRPTLLNVEALTPEQSALLDRKVTVAVPTSPLDVKRVGKLKDALPVLSRQLGVEVVAEPGLEQLPVSPTYFKDARVKTVLDLMIRQWPVPEFGYLVQQSGDATRIVIQRKR